MDASLALERRWRLVGLRGRFCCLGRGCEASGGKSGPPQATRVGVSLSA